MPDAFYRLLAVPNGIAMIGLGYSLWRTARTATTVEPSGEPPVASMPAPRAPSTPETSAMTTATGPPDGPTRH
jgi:hypothetical protein